MYKVEEFYSSEHLVPVPACALRKLLLQPNQPKIWVMNKNVHIDEDGNYLSSNNSPYCWISIQNHGMPNLPTNNSACTAVCASLTEATLALSHLINSLKAVYLQNFPAALLMLGALVMCTHYEAIFDIAGQVPVILA